jgi:hypothetical protein
MPPAAHLAPGGSTSTSTSEAAPSGPGDPWHSDCEESTSAGSSRPFAFSSMPMSTRTPPYGQVGVVSRGIARYAIAGCGVPCGASASPAEHAIARAARAREQHRGFVRVT